MKSFVAQVSKPRRNDDGFIEFRNVDMRVGRIDGVRYSCGLLGSSRLLRADAPAD